MDDVSTELPAVSSLPDSSRAPPTPDSSTDDEDSSSVGTDEDSPSEEEGEVDPVVITMPIDTDVSFVTFGDLPNDLFVAEILPYLSVTDLCRVSLVNHRFHDLATCDVLWMKFRDRLFKHPKTVTKDIYQTYLGYFGEVGRVAHLFGHIPCIYTTWVFLFTLICCVLCAGIIAVSILGGGFAFYTSEKDRQWFGFACLVTLGILGGVFAFALFGLLGGMEFWSLCYGRRMGQAYSRLQSEYRETVREEERVLRLRREKEERHRMREEEGLGFDQISDDEEEGEGEENAGEQGEQEEGGGEDGQNRNRRRGGIAGVPVLFRFGNRGFGGGALEEQQSVYMTYTFIQLIVWCLTLLPFLVLAALLQLGLRHIIPFFENTRTTVVFFVVTICVHEFIGCGCLIKVYVAGCITSDEMRDQVYQVLEQLGYNGCCVNCCTKLCCLAFFVPLCLGIDGVFPMEYLPIAFIPLFAMLCIFALFLGYSLLLLGGFLGYFVWKQKWRCQAASLGCSFCLGFLLWLLCTAAFGLLVIIKFAASLTFPAFYVMFPLWATIGFVVYIAVVSVCIGRFAILRQIRDKARKNAENERRRLEPEVVQEMEAILAGGGGGDGDGGGGDSSSSSSSSTEVDDFPVVDEDKCADFVELEVAKSKADM